MTNASPIRLADRNRVEQASYPLLGSRQLAPCLVQLLLQIQEFGTDVSRPGDAGVTHVSAAVRADVNEPFGLEHPQGSRHRVARDSVRIFKLPVRRELRTGPVLPVFDACAELARYTPAVTALLVCVRHSAIVPSWLTPKLLTKRLSYNYCRKPINCYAPVDLINRPEEV
jgi:hypothetical protein